MKLVLRCALLISGLLLVISGMEGPAEASRCGLAGSDDALPGTDLTGYWQGTLGLMRLVRTAPGMVEGPASGSEYLHGAFDGHLWQGETAIDTGEKHHGTFTIEMTDGGRCLKGSINWGDGTDEVLGQRVAKPAGAYTTYYVIDQNTEQLEHMVGGLLNLNLIDGPDNQINPSALAAPVQPITTSATSAPPHSDSSDTDSDTQSEDP